MSDNDPSEPVDAGAQVHDDDRDFDSPTTCPERSPSPRRVPLRAGRAPHPGTGLQRARAGVPADPRRLRLPASHRPRPSTTRRPALPPEETTRPADIPGVVMLTMTGRGEGHLREVPQILDTIRTVDRAVRAPQVAPNHVFFGSTHALWARPGRYGWPSASPGSPRTARARGSPSSYSTRAPSSEATTSTSQQYVMFLPNLLVQFMPRWPRGALRTPPDRSSGRAPRRCLRLADGPPDPLRRRGHLDVPHAELGQRVDDGVDDDAQRRASCRLRPRGASRADAWARALR